MRTEAELRADLVDEARAWVGTPYGPYGREKGVKADCIFLEAVGRAVLGFPNRYRSYSLMPQKRLIEHYADRDLRLVACNCAKPCAGCAGKTVKRGIGFADLRPGRLALFYGRNPDEPQHFGMLAEHPRFAGAITLIHAHGREPNGKVIEATLTTREEWAGRGARRSFTGRLHKLYDFPGVAE